MSAIAWKVSPSQLENFAPEFDGCERRWAFQYIENLPKKTSPGADFGISVHNVLEEALAVPQGQRKVKAAQAGESARATLLAMSGLHLYPETLPYALETKFKFDHGGITYGGKFDGIWLDPLTLVDHKTSSDPKKWGVTAAKMPTNHQALIYGKWALQEFHAKQIRVMWVYYSTQGKKEAPYIVVRDLSKALIDENFEKMVHPPAQRIIHAIQNVQRAIELEPNEDACGAFGGCPYAQFCPRDNIASVFGVKKRSNIVPLDFKKMLNRKLEAPRPEQLAANAGGLRLPEKPGVVLGLSSAGVAKPQGLDPSKVKWPGLGTTATAPATEPDRPIVMPGFRVNSPEAPATVEEARETSFKIGALQGTPKEKSEQARAVANEAQGAPTEGSITLTRDQLLEHLARGHGLFTSSKEAGTAVKPYVHAKTLSTLAKDGVITFIKSGTDYHVNIPQGDATAGKGIVDQFYAKDPAEGMKLVDEDADVLLQRIREAQEAGKVSDGQRQTWITFAAATQDATRADRLFVEYMRRFA